VKKIVLFLFIFSSLFGEIGTLIEKNGIVKDKHKNSIKKVSLKIDDEIEEYDTIYTYNSIAVIKLKDGSIIKLAPHSQLKFNKNKISQKNGEIYFNIKKRKIHKLKVATNFTTIGVKGTIFIVNDDNKNKSVALKNGVLTFKVLKGKYEIHRKKLMNEFEQFKAQQQNEFENYKNKLYKEFVEYKSQFQLKQNKIVSFNGNRVYENNFNKNNLSEFQKFENEFKLSQFNIKSSKNSEKNNLKEGNNKEEENNDDLEKELDELEKDMKQLQNDFYQ
jgi:hypothetical protein